MSDDPTLEDLRKRASELNIDGRSKMDRGQLETAIAAADTAQRHRDAQDGATDAVVTEGQIAAAALAAAGPDLRPGTPDEVGRPDLADLAADRAANRRPRVIG